MASDLGSTSYPPRASAIRTGSGESQTRRIGITITSAAWHRQHRERRCQSPPPCPPKVRHQRPPRQHLSPAQLLVQLGATAKVRILSKTGARMAAAARIREPCALKVATFFVPVPSAEIAENPTVSSIRRRWLANPTRIFALPNPARRRQLLHRRPWHRRLPHRRPCHQHPTLRRSLPPTRTAAVRESCCIDTLT